MVDEFQDTNRLQCDLVDLLRSPGTEIFFVGDEYQSIYGFRHADVQVFRERRASCGAAAAADAQLPLAPRGARRGQRALRLALRRRVPAARRGGRVPRSGVRPSGRAARSPTRRATPTRDVHWRRAEARAVARRVRELVDTGTAVAGEIVLLFAAGTDAEVYEEELRKTGLPTYRATGRGYFGQQQVVDLLSYLRLLHNRYDDTALLTVLASPFVGISNNGLALVRRAASKRPLFAGIEHSLPPALDERDTRLLRAFRQRFDRLSDAMARLSLERLCERIVGDHDYDLAVLAQWDGRRRYANMRKLARLARSYEELRGPDVEGFVRFVGEQEAVGARELEAVAEEEGADAVRLLDDPCGEGARVQGRDRRRRRPRQGAAVARRDPCALRRPLRLPRRRPGDDEAPRRLRLRRGARGAQGRGGGREAPPLLRRDDAREGAADRLRLDRPREEGGRVDADRLGARPSRRRRGADRRGRRRPSRSRGTTRGSSCASTGSTRPSGRRPSRPSEPEPEAGQLELFAALEEAAAAAAAPVLAAARRARRAAASPPAAALVHRALDVRPVLVQVLRALRRRG